MSSDPHEGVTQLPAADCWRLLRRADVGRLATSVGGCPDIFPVNFVVDGESVVFRTAEGTKLAASVIAPQVAFEADGYDRAAGTAWSVVLKGHAELQSMFDVLDTAFDSLLSWHNAPKERFVRITPSEVSGRCFSVRSDVALAPEATPTGP
jgi:hypothetical protein